MNVTHLHCSACSKRYEPNQLLNLCECGKPLLVNYDLDAVRITLSKDSLHSRIPSMWRYEEILPLVNKRNRISLGEGFTPLHHARRLGAALEAPNLFIKDESLNPTQSFKARGMTAAVSMAYELGVKKAAVPSAGNAAGALSAYAALAGIEAHIFVPSDTPSANIIECQSLGAHVTLVDGLITDCGKIVAERKEEEGWFDVSTLKEPYRIEGKKTMGYELAEQMDWELPDVVFYPTGGGTGLIGMWKAFDEMEELGWIGSFRPRMVAVQSSGCAPIVEAFHQGMENGTEIRNAHTVASGLRVPKAIGDFIILNILRKSGGTAVAVSDEELVSDARAIGAYEGIFAAPEGGALLSALKKLSSAGKVRHDERIVLFNTGSGIKYLEAFKS
ncbi:MAG: threonine synthase [Acidobacteria bacterium]|nr:MAG: threonine synthase [Acidobacteriota bacterium]REJ97968.1 MAG: threonine synthase [Acidobacteriota bacterium]REK16711.1 MAG: threonine synthase [Acidobacteriota bacterium]REK42622.1 MAG: threonine synthase [Acidobacteriota bacterium]